MLNLDSPTSPRSDSRIESEVEDAQVKIAQLKRRLEKNFPSMTAETPVVAGNFLPAPTTGKQQPSEPSSPEVMEIKQAFHVKLKNTTFDLIEQHSYRLASEKTKHE